MTPDGNPDEENSFFSWGSWSEAYAEVAGSSWTFHAWYGWKKSSPKSEDKTHDIVELNKENEGIRLKNGCMDEIMQREGIKQRKW